MAPDPAAADLYERLGVGRSAGEDEIKRAYRKLALQYHPDRCADDTATATFQHISEAYAVLSDSAKRRNYDEFGEADVDDFDLDDFMDAAFGEGGSFADVFAELMAMGGMEAEDEEEMGDMQRSFESYLKASMGKGDPDGKVLMPDGSRVPFAALADSEDMLSLMMMAGGLGDEVDEDEMEELMEMMGAMAGGGRGGFGALLGGGFGPRVRVKSGSRGPSSARNRRKKASKKAKAAAASASGAASASAASGSASSGGASSRVGEQEEVPFSTLWLECAKANDTSGLARVLAAHPEVLSTPLCAAANHKSRPREVTSAARAGRRGAARSVAAKRCARFCLSTLRSSEHAALTHASTRAPCLSRAPLCAPPQPSSSLTHWATRRCTGRQCATRSPRRAGCSTRG